MGMVSYSTLRVFAAGTKLVGVAKRTRQTDNMGRKYPNGMQSGKILLIHVRTIIRNSETDWEEES